MNPRGNNTVKAQSVKIKKIYIENFRRFRDVELCFGDKITLICGRNCTSKSTALGLLCQPLSFGERVTSKKSVYINSYHNFNLFELKTLTGVPFKRDAFEIFRISQVYDKPKELLYHLFFEGSAVNLESNNLKNGLRVRSEPRTTTKNRTLRFVTGQTHNAGEGNFPHPLIYLGLDRLYPLASCQSVEIKEVDEKISDVDKKWCEEQYNYILLLDEENGKTESVRVDKGHRKNYLGHRTKKYDSESCSAGQDNVGQILTAILSFKYLKETLGENYQGGVLVIDEIDATLHPQAQEHLLKLLKKACEIFSLQVIATTHSLYMLELATKSKLSQDINVCHLERIGDKVICKNDVTYEMISDFLKVEVTKYKQKEKTTVLLEDPVAVWMFCHLVGGFLDNYIFTPKNCHISGCSLIEQASFEIKCYKQTLFIVDADLAGLISKTKRNNLLSLPGELPPEKEIFFLLYELPEGDSFWMNKLYPTYTKKVCFKNYSSLGKTKESVEEKNRENEMKEYKDWFNEQRIYWMGDGVQVIKLWTEKNMSKCHDFCSSLISSLEKMRQEQIPETVKDKILAPYKKFEEILEANTSEKHIRKATVLKPKSKKNTELKDSGNGTVQPEFSF